MAQPLPAISIVRGARPVKKVVHIKSRVFGQLTQPAVSAAPPVAPRTLGLTQALELVRLRGGDAEAARELITKLPGVTTGAIGKNKTYSIPEPVFNEFLDSQYPEEA